MNGIGRLIRYSMGMGALLWTLGCTSPTTENASGNLDDLQSSEVSQSDAGSAAEGSDQLFSDMESAQNDSQELPPPAEQPLPSAPSDTAVQEPLPEALTQAPPEVLPTENTAAKATIQSLDFKAFSNGGTVVVQANKPLQFKTRTNSSLNQFVVEIENAILPPRLQRPLLAKDIPGSVGAIQAFQSPTSSNVNLVVQLRSGGVAPVATQQGNSLLVMMQEGSPQQPESLATSMGSSSNGSVSPQLQTSGNQLLSSASLEDYLRSNSRFYGKKISIEFDDIELRDVFKLISEEAGINLIIADDVKGKMSLKLREVPWDQALVLILKSRRLGYTRSGNVMRIANLNEIRQEEDDAVKAAIAIKDTAPLRVKLIVVSYAPVADIEKQVKPFLSKRGNIATDPRTSSVIVSDIDEVLERVEKLVASIDVPPTQVLVEGKIIEASDQFERRYGISWQASGKDIPVGSQTLSVPFNVTPSSSRGGASTFSFNPQLGIMDALGSLSASLTLYEREGTIKVLSSPRITTLHNEPASITQSVQIPIVSSTPGPGGVPINNVTYRDVKLALNVTPQVTHDGGVIMQLDVQREIAGEIESSSGNRPINSRSAKTKVLVRNGQTAVIGGIYQNDSTEGENRVPGLGNLPVVGWLFKSKTRDVRKNELLIFLSPKVIAQSTPVLEMKKGEL